MLLVYRPKMTPQEADEMIERARQFFAGNPRRRVFRVGDGDRPWFNIRKSYIELDVRVHSQNGKCPTCGSSHVEATKEGLLFCWDCEMKAYFLKRGVKL